MSESIFPLESGMLAFFSVSCLSFPGLPKNQEWDLKKAVEKLFDQKVEYKDNAVHLLKGMLQGKKYKEETLQAVMQRITFVHTLDDFKIGNNGKTYNLNDGRDLVEALYTAVQTFVRSGFYVNNENSLTKDDAIMVCRAAADSSSPIIHKTHLNLPLSRLFSISRQPTSPSLPVQPITPTTSSQSSEAGSDTDSCAGLDEKATASVDASQASRSPWARLREGIQRLWKRG